LEAAVLRKHQLAGLVSLNETTLPGMHREFRAMGMTISFLTAGLLVCEDGREETAKLWPVHLMEE
jgi:hypothetical protein